ncbi:Rv3235 family protein [Sciscionella marina]|uniref:Rv3235 family protein n=1 Tax=Sciscionella marina TaxID=508770 RepID=UPI00039D4D0D|nr:Rv3235 family protein [Sciscionella marina]
MFAIPRPRPRPRRLLAEAPDGEPETGRLGVADPPGADGPGVPAAVRPLDRRFPGQRTLAALLRALLEVLDGRRPLGALGNRAFDGLLAPAVTAGITNRIRTRGFSAERMLTGLAFAMTHRANALEIWGSAREPGSGRTVALAARVELCGDHLPWWCTAFTVLD